MPSEAELLKKIELLEKRVEHYKNAIIEAQYAISYRGASSIKSVYSDLQEARENAP